MPAYEIGPIRPPNEAASLLIRVTRNCPWNRCAFCPVFKGETFSMRSVGEVCDDIDAAFSLHGDVYRKAFLQDANSICVPTPDLVAILHHLRATFPGLRRVTTYGRAKNIARRPVEDLFRLRDAGLSRIHVGLESGSAAILAQMEKGATVAQQIEAGRRVKAAGLGLSEYVILGLGGRALTREHAAETARVVNAIDPDFVRARTLRIIEGTPLHGLERAGAFDRLDEAGIVRELRRLIEGLTGFRGRFESDHGLNLLMEVRGRFPGARPHLLETIDRFLALPQERREVFILGRRIGAFRRLSDLDTDPLRVREVEAVAERIRAGGGTPEAVAYDRMRRLL